MPIWPLRSAWWRRGIPLLAALLALLFAPGQPGRASAHANLDRADPAAGSALPAAPAEIRLAFTEPLELKYSGIEVYDQDRRTYSGGPARLAPGDAHTLIVAVADLPQGNYTVVWRANSSEDGHTTTGGYVFAVGSVPPPAATGDATDGPVYAPPSPREVATRWLLLLAVMAFAGALGLWPLVWRFALRRCFPAGAREARVLASRAHRRLLLLAGTALAAILVATCAGLAIQVAKVTGRAVADLDIATIRDFLLGTRAGAIWLVRLLIPLVAGLLLGPQLATAARAARGKGAAGGEEADPPAGPWRAILGLALGAGYLLTISLTSHAAAAPFWIPFAVALDWAHQLATAVWVGGLGGLALTVPLVRSLPGSPRPILGTIATRCSAIALASLGILAATGLYSAWLHVGSWEALTSTAYGRILGLKLALVAGLVGAGAGNLLWLRPRLAAGRRGGARARVADDRLGARLLGSFGRTLRAEVALAALVLLAVALLTGFAPAREALAQARAPKRAQTAAAGDLEITLNLGTLQPGENSFDVRVLTARGDRPISDAERVIIRIAHNEMDMGESEAIAEPRGDGHYVAAGPYLAMSGSWQLRAIVRRGGAADVEARFAVRIGSAANPQSAPSRATKPSLATLASPPVLGSLLLAAGVGLAAGGVMLFRRGSGWGTALLLLVPTALVVGGYLLANGGASGPILDRAPELTNPVVADGASIERGRTVFADNCVACHGPQARGDGPQAGRLDPRPPDMSLPHTAAHSDGYMFNAITDGLPGSAMTAWGPALTERTRWDLVNYLRTMNPLTAGPSPSPPAGPGQPVLTPIPPAVGTARATMAPPPPGSPTPAPAASAAATVSAADLTATAPAWPPPPSTSAAGLAQRRAVGDLVAELQLRPRIFGPTAVELRLADRSGQPPPDVARVDVQFAMAEMAHGANGIVATSLGGGRYGAEAALLTMEGSWALALRIERAGGGIDSALFPFQMGADAPDGPISAYYARPADPVQIADIQVLYDVIVPNRVAVIAGRPVRLEVIFSARPGCGATIILPDSGTAAPVSPEGIGEVAFAPARSGRLGLDCTADGLRVRYLNEGAGDSPVAGLRERVGWRPRSARRRRRVRAADRGPGGLGAAIASREGVHWHAS